MKKSSQSFPAVTSCPSTRESFSPVCRIGWESPLSAQSLIRNMLRSVFVCLCEGHSHSLGLTFRLPFYTFPPWREAVCVGWLGRKCLVMWQPNNSILLPFRTPLYLLEERFLCVCEAQQSKTNEVSCSQQINSQTSGKTLNQS